MNKNIIQKISSTLLPESLKRPVRILRSLLAAAYYGFPSSKLKIIGVTGTSGKSTTANMIFHVLNESDLKVGLISTVGAKVGKKNIETGLHVTTPDPAQFQKLLKYMVKRGAEYVVVEASSHALAQGRLGLTEFAHCVYTNIKRDHLDWHKTWNNYASAKARLADQTYAKGSIVINRDDKDAYNFLADHIDPERFEKYVLTYSLKELQKIEETAVGTRFSLNGLEFQVPLLGLYNVENALAAINIAGVLGLTYEQVSSALKTFMGIEGRMQLVKSHPYLVIIDFAHNADSLEKSLQTAQKLTSYNGRVIVVFGSAGHRDVEKRYKMGEVAAEYSDILVVTTEDPRSELTKDINNQIIHGASKKGASVVARFENSQDYKSYPLDKENISKNSMFVFDEDDVRNRVDAIELAIRIAKEGDVVITEGKGHEKSLCFGNTEHPYSEHEAVEYAIRNVDSKRV